MQRQSWVRRALVGLGVATVAAVAAPAHAQEGGLRPFTTQPTEINRSDRVVYVPLASKFPGPRPGNIEYGVAAAAWYQQPLGARNVKPDDVLDKGEYTLERFEMATPGAVSSRPLVRVVITRRSGAAPGANLPLLEVVDAETGISAQRVSPSVEALGQGVRFSYVTMLPLWGVASLRPGAAKGEGRRYGLRFLPERGVELPRYFTLAPTFGGADLETRMNQGPPKLPVEERVAGKRIEYRSGKVIENPKK